jgi:hypothetical protein
MPKLLKPTEHGLPDLPLRPVESRYKRYGKLPCCLECGEAVSEYRWSPFFCADHDVLRMAHIDRRMKEFADGFPTSQGDE